MGSGSSRGLLVLGGLCFALGTTVAGRGQHTQPGSAPFGVPPAVMPGTTAAPADPALSESRRRQAEMRNDERQKQLVADTDKLLELATSLHEDVAKTNKNVLSLDVIRRADEIERLAHAVKERMRAS